MTKPFCLYTTNSARFNYDKFEPCCWITRKLDLKTATADKVTEYHNWLSSIDSWVPECNFCQEKEVKGIVSPRQTVDNYPSKLGVNNESDIGILTSLELQIDTTCNAACLICGNHNSTTWQKYNIGSIDNKSEFNKQIDLVNYNQTQQRFDKILKTVSLEKINVVFFLGGEPLHTDLHKQMLLEIQKHKSLSQVSARYTTNGSKIPDAETLELWKQLKSVSVSFSLDGIEDHFNYWRWPLQWNQVEKNIQYFITLKKTLIPTMQFGISSAINPFNIFYYDRYIEWENRIFPPTQKLKFSDAFDSVNIVNTSCIPSALMEQIEEKYIDHPWLIKRMRPFDQIKFNNFMKYIDHHDQRRGLNWRDIFPEIVKYFDQQLPTTTS